MGRITDSPGDSYEPLEGEGEESPHIGGRNRKMRRKSYKERRRE